MDTKLKTGVPGLDEIFKGGIREKSAVLISGGPGTGKTIFAMQFLEEGAKRGEAGLFLIYDSSEENLLTYADSLGINLRKYVQSGLVTIYKQPLLLRKVPTLPSPLQLLKNKKIKRVALDSLTMFAYVHVADDKQYRSQIISFLEHMKEVTLLATAEAPGSNIDEADFRAEDFLFDGVVFLTKVRQEAHFERVLHVSKMRGQEHILDIIPFTIGLKGISVYPSQLPFALISKESSSSKLRVK